MGEARPREPHWHLGPVGVDRPLQGRGVGGALLRAFCARMDAEGSASYLETDKPENVSIYEHFGFRTIAEDRVLGITNWFMMRVHTTIEGRA
jgi:GNAT superfamily N-acetyltransferase